MCEYCEKPNKTIVAHVSGVTAFVGAGHLWLRLYVKKRNRTFLNLEAINFCPMCGKKFTNH